MEKNRDDFVNFSSAIRAFLAATLLAFIAAPAFALTAVDQDMLGGGAHVDAGDSITLQHSFAAANDTSIEISSIDSVWLYVAVAADATCTAFDGCTDDYALGVESAAVDLNSVIWRAGGSGSAAVFFGDVAAEADLLSNNGVISISVTSSEGFSVLWSMIEATYTYEFSTVDTGGIGGGVSPMPEPSAALVFAIGALVMHGQVRRRSRRRS